MDPACGLLYFGVKFKFIINLGFEPTSEFAPLSAPGQWNVTNW